MERIPVHLSFRMMKKPDKSFSAIKKHTKKMSFREELFRTSTFLDFSVAISMIEEAIYNSKIGDSEKLGKNVKDPKIALVIYPEG